MSQPQPDYSWAEYLDYMEGGGSDVLHLPAAKPVVSADKKLEPLWGLLVAFGVTVVAMVCCELPSWLFNFKGKNPVEPVMLAIILGMVLSNLFPLPKILQPGIKLSVKKLLPLGIVLLGARLDFSVMKTIGTAGLCLSVLEIVVALALMAVLTRMMKLPDKLGTLLGIGTAICGGTAIVATAPVIEAEEKDVVMGVATVTLLGLLAMFALPVLGHLLELTDQAFGIWAGLSIHQTPQVIAAGFAYSNEAGQTATVAKLARVCLLAPVVFIVGIIYARRKIAATGVAAKKKINYLHLFPMFVLGFLGMALLKTFGLLPHLDFGGGKSYAVGDLADQVSKFCITVSMAGVGLETKFSAMKQTGIRPFVASLIAVIILAALVLVLIQSFGIGLVAKH